MPRDGRSVVAAAVTFALAAILLGSGPAGFSGTRAALAAPAPGDAATGALRITYPADGTLFPPESVAPTFVWEDGAGDARLSVVVRDAAGGELARDLVDAPRWRPTEETWQK